MKQAMIKNQRRFEHQHETTFQKVSTCVKPYPLLLFDFILITFSIGFIFIDFNMIHFFHKELQYNINNNRLICSNLMI